MPANAKEVSQLRAELRNTRDKIDELEGKLNATMKILHGLIIKLQENKHIARILDSDSENPEGVPVQSEGTRTYENRG